MSANNWTVCPRCTQTYVSKIARAKQALNDSYGKVPIEEYERLLENLQTAQKENEEEPETLREDYEQGIYNGHYRVSYSGSCENCGFEFEYKFEKEVS